MCNGKNHVDTLKVSTPMHKALIFFNSSKTNTTLHVTTNYPLKLGQYIVSKRENIDFFSLFINIYLLPKNSWYLTKKNHRYNIYSYCNIQRFRCDACLLSDVHWLEIRTVLFFLYYVHSAPKFENKVQFSNRTVQSTVIAFGLFKS